MINRNRKPIWAVGCLIVSFICLLCITACDPEDVVTILGEFEIPGRFTSNATESMYIMMPDGVRLAMDVTLPQPLEAGDEVPTIVMMTRCWRATEGGTLSWWEEEAVGQGFAFVKIDERGTGASFGTWPYSYSDQSLNDYAEVVDWIVRQDWSNGRVGSWGISYAGMMGQLLTAKNHPAVRVAIPAFTQYDVLTDIAAPGGILLDWFLREWSETVSALDRNQRPGGGEGSVKPVDGDIDGSLLAAAVAEHVNNGNLYESFKDVVYRDRLSSAGITVDEMSGHRLQEEIEASGAVLYLSGGWMDHTTAHSVITRFLTMDNVGQAVIGPWTRGGVSFAGPYSPAGADPIPSEAKQWRQILNFMDWYLRSDTTAGTEKLLHYYTYGAEEWNTTSVWPVDGTTFEQWYFGAGNTLSTIMPPDSTGSDRYVVDFTTTTGDMTRWHSALGNAVEYADRCLDDERLLSYTSGPLAEDTEITGYPSVKLYVSSTHTDGAFYVYLEEVDESGRVTYLTEGQLRALHRKVSDAVPPYELLAPYHTFKEADGEPMVPGEIAEIAFGLLPTSVLIPAGHRIRVALAGHDDGLFVRVPDTGDPVITLERNAVYRSRIELPIVRRSR